MRRLLAFRTTRRVSDGDGHALYVSCLFQTEVASWPIHPTCRFSQARAGLTAAIFCGLILRDGDFVSSFAGRSNAFCRGVSAGELAGIGSRAGSDGPDEPEEALAGLQKILTGMHAAVQRVLNV